MQKKIVTKAWQAWERMGPKRSISLLLRRSQGSFQMYSAAHKKENSTFTIVSQLRIKELYLYQ